MSAFLGMDDQTVGQLATRLIGAASDIDGIVDRVGSKLASTTWSGQDHDRFVQQWNEQHVSHLRAIAENFRGKSTEALHRVSAQQQTSNQY